MQQFYDSVAITGSSSTNEILSIMGNSGVGSGRFNTNQAELYNLVPHSGGTFPTTPTPVTGQLFEYTGTGGDGAGLYQYLSGAWVKLINKTAMDASISTLNTSITSQLTNYMLKSVYDTDANGKVDNADNADKLNGQAGSYYTNPANLTSAVSYIKGGTGLTTLGNANQLLGVNSTTTGLEYKTLAGTTNQVTVTNTSGNIALALPQNIHTGATPTFSSITISSDPSTWSGTNAATKAYVDARAVGLKVKTSVRVATTANITTSNAQTIDGVALVIGDRVLVKNQTTPSANGIYVVASGQWGRASDCNSWADLYQSYVWIDEGSTHAQQGWLCAIASTGTLNTDAITFAKFSEAGMISAGDGLTKAGEVISVNFDTTSTMSDSGKLAVKVDSTGGIERGTNGIKAKLQTGLYSDSTGIGITAGYASKFFESTFPASLTSANSSIEITHNLNDIPYSIRFSTAAGITVYPEVISIAANTITVKFSKSLAANEMMCQLIAIR